MARPPETPDEMRARMRQIRQDSERARAGRSLLPSRRDITEDLTASAALGLAHLVLTALSALVGYLVGGVGGAVAAGLVGAAFWYGLWRVGATVVAAVGLVRRTRRPDGRG